MQVREGNTKMKHGELKEEKKEEHRERNEQKRETGRVLEAGETEVGRGGGWMDIPRD